MFLCALERILHSRSHTGPHRSLASESTHGSLFFPLCEFVGHVSVQDSIWIIFSHYISWFHNIIFLKLKVILDISYKFLNSWKKIKWDFFLPFCLSGKLKDNTENFAVDYCYMGSSLASLFWLIFFIIFSTLFPVYSIQCLKALDKHY